VGFLQLPKELAAFTATARSDSNYSDQR